MNSGSSKQCDHAKNKNISVRLELVCDYGRALVCEGAGYKRVRERDKRVCEGVG